MEATQDAKNARIPAGLAAGPVRAAVASNFMATFTVLADSFLARTGIEVVGSAAATAQLYAQICNGAPFEVFLAADSLHPARLEREGLAVPGTRRTYALGRLVLWSADPQRIGSDGAAALGDSSVRRVAIANPRNAPYGRAAEQTLRKLGLLEVLESRLVFGANIGQTLQFVESGNANLGFVARAQVMDPRLAARGSRWDVPASLHDPLVQDVVLVGRGTPRPEARALLEFLQSPQALAVLGRFGYGLPGESAARQPAPVRSE